ncbi:MAG: hypothetical protein SGI92_16890 [Bryobacteraceae bacterium]|nr:hypothetical protein [Bryobacteraceae bacterium]
MQSEVFAIALINYVVFLFSVVCHEAAHAVVGMWGGDKTAYWNGQVTLSPVPHIRQEPFGLGLLPLISMFAAMQSGGYGIIGFASAPYDPLWALRHPRRAGWMALAGPAANLLLAAIAAILLKVGIFAGYLNTRGVLGDDSGTAFSEAITIVLTALLFENLLLMTWNLLPIPPMDGFSALLLFVPGSKAASLLNFRSKIGMFFPITLLVISRFFWNVFGPFYATVNHILFG